MPGQDPTWGRDQLLYPLEDPEKAWNNALQDQGYNVYASNPFTQSLQRAGRGNRLTYLMDHALYGQGGGGQTHNNTSDYGAYLKNQIAGGNAFYNLNRGYVQLQPAVQKIRQFQADLARGGQTVRDANPYLALLNDELSANGGRGTSDAMAYLRAPLLGSQMGRSYTNMLGDVVDQAGRTLANDPYTYQPGNKRDIWSYIFGTAGSPF